MIRTRERENPSPQKGKRESYPGQKGKRGKAGEVFCDPIPLGNQTARTHARTKRTDLTVWLTPKPPIFEVTYACFTWAQQHLFGKVNRFKRLLWVPAKRELSKLWVPTPFVTLYIDHLMTPRKQEKTPDNILYDTHSEHNISNPNQCTSGSLSI